MTVAEIQPPDSLDSLHRMIPDSIADTSLTIGNANWCQDTISNVSWLQDTVGDAAGWIGCDVMGTLPDTITAESVFGVSSRLADIPDIAIWAMVNPSPLTDNIVFKLSVIVCFIAFCLLTYLFRGQIFALFSVFRGTVSTEKMIGQSRVFDIFLNWTVTLGLLVLGMTTIKFVEIAAWQQIAEVVPEWAPYLMVPAAWGLCALIFGYQFVVLKIAGGLTLSTIFTFRLFYLKKIILALTTILLTPVFLVFVLSHGKSTEILSWIMFFIVGSMVIFLIFRTFIFFIRQNLSISLWFLYLCAVEIFPASLIWIIAGKIL